MKKKLIVFLLVIVSLLLVGCGKQDDLKKGWIIDLTDSKQTLDKEVRQIFSEAKDSYDGELEYVALLAKQVVAGTNYMFLCKDEENYKIAVVYNDLEGISKITKVSDFDPIKYVNENYESGNKNLSGGWYVDIPEEKIELSKEIQTRFDKATEAFAGGTYYPIAVLAHQDKEGISYAILCYGEGSYTGSDTDIFMLTLYVDETGTPEISSICAINLSDYNN